LFFAISQQFTEMDLRLFVYTSKASMYEIFYGSDFIAQNEFSCDHLYKVYLLIVQNLQISVPHGKFHPNWVKESARNGAQYPFPAFV